MSLHKTADAAKEANSIDNHSDGDGLNLGVSVVGEVADNPPVSLLDKVDEDTVEEEAHHDNAGAVVPAAFHNWVHCRFGVP